MSVRFGEKPNVSLSGNGLANRDHSRWRAYNEGTDLQAQIDSYKTTYGLYPEVVLTDRIYGPGRTVTSLNNTISAMAGPSRLSKERDG